MSDQETIVEYSSDVSEAERPDPLPIAKYPADVAMAEVKESATTGNKYYAITFRINPDNYPADYDAEMAPDGTNIIFRRVSAEDTPQGRFSVRRFCEAVGAPMSTRIDCSEWIGLGAAVSVGHDEYQGEVRAQIESVEAA